ncbi:ATP-binding protein [Nonomuraea fuscirosea]
MAPVSAGLAAAAASVLAASVEWEIPPAAKIGVTLGAAVLVGLTTWATTDARGTRRRVPLEPGVFAPEQWPPVPEHFTGRAEALAELREVAWRAYPSGLDLLGLGEALAGVAERSSVPVTVDCRLDERPPMAVETAAYFVVCEAVTNAAKHAGAALITVEVEREDGAVAVRVRDDGAGGARTSGGGLSGLARRVAALDGRFEVSSPAGGPTVVTAVLPCG